MARRVRRSSFIARPRLDQPEFVKDGSLRTATAPVPKRVVVDWDYQPLDEAPESAGAGQTTSPRMENWEEARWQHYV